MIWLKTILAGFTVGAAINTIYDLQDLNYFLGTATGLIVIALTIFLAVKEK